MSEADSPIELSLITADPDLARCAISAGVDRIFIDLETLGKQARQAGKGLFLSSHQPEDIAKLAAVVSRGRLMVRLNPLHVGSADEIDFAVRYGVGSVMLPVFEDAAQVEEFIRLVNKRARVSLLLENRYALANIGEVLAVRGIEEIHVGLNDLALSLGLAHWFDVLATPILEELSARVIGQGVHFGFGGVTSPNAFGLPISPQCVIGEQVRLRSRMALLGRSFRGMFEPVLSADDLRVAVQSIRRCIHYWQSVSPVVLAANHTALVTEIALFHQQKLPD